MKRKIFLACAALVVSAAAVVGVNAYNYYSMPELMRANLEALSQGENQTHISNFKSGDVWVLTHLNGRVEVSYEAPSWAFIGDKEKYRCCINGADMDACDFSKEDSQCAQYVVRNPH